MEAPESSARIKQPTGAAESEVLFGNQHARSAEVHNQLILADREFDVVGRSGRLLDFIEDWRIENQIGQCERIERRGSRIEHRIVAQLIDRVIFEEFDQPDRDRDRELRRSRSPTVGFQGAICGIEATGVAVTAERDPSHAIAPRVERKLRAGRAQGSEHEQDKCNSDDSSSHKAPRGLERPPQLCTLCPIFPFFGVRKVTQTGFTMRFGASE